MLFHSLQEARNRWKIADNCRETHFLKLCCCCWLTQRLCASWFTFLRSVPVSAVFLNTVCYLSFVSDWRLFTWSREMHSNTHYAPVLLKTGFHGEAGWESFKGHCLHTHVCAFVCEDRSDGERPVCCGSIVFSEWKPCLSRKIGYYSSIELILQVQSRTQESLS